MAPPGTSITLSYPDPELHYPSYSLRDLPEPPADWLLFGETDSSFLRRFTRAELDNLANFHFWGIDPAIEGVVTSGKRMKALRKLVYHQELAHRPQSFEDFVDFTRDAGPRLLSLQLTPSPLPISRHYPDPPHPDHARLKRAFSRPPHVPSDIPDIHVQQFLLPAEVQARRPWRPSNAAPATARGRNARSLTPAISQLGRNARNARSLTPRASQLTSAPIDPRQGNFASQSQTLATVKEEPEMIDLTMVDEHVDERPPADPALAATVAEAIERAVMGFAYKCLERHPSASSQVARPALTATTPQDLLKAVVGSFSATSRVALSGDVYNFDPRGTLYQYRGRGPVYRNSSSGLDSVIVAGMLLDAGSTILDRGNGWENLFTETERAFIEAADLNWDVYSGQTSADLRDRFWRVVEKNYREIQFGEPSNIFALWLACTTNFAQFHFSRNTVRERCGCSNIQPGTTNSHNIFIAPDEDSNGVTMEQLLARHFSPAQNCAVCGRACQFVSYSRLPMRMVVAPENGERIRNHTRNVSFEYCDEDGHTRTASYRWLGGIYAQGGHYRVYWTDAQRGEHDVGAIRMYDSSVNLGLIVGGIPPAHPDDRVPAVWWQNESVPLLFYERILNPDSDVLSSARVSITQMMNIQQENKLILQQHKPWTPMDSMSPAETSQPWPRVLTDDYSRFATVPAIAYPLDRISGLGTVGNSSSSADDDFAVYINHDMLAEPTGADDPSSASPPTDDDEENFTPDELLTVEELQALGLFVEDGSVSSTGDLDLSMFDDYEDLLDVDGK